MSTAVATPSRGSIREEELSPNIMKEKLRIRSKEKQILKFKIKCSHKSAHSYHERGLIKRNDINWIAYNCVISIYHTWLRLAPFLHYMVSKTNEEKIKRLKKLTKAVEFEKEKMEVFEKKTKQMKEEDLIDRDESEAVNYEILEQIKTECLELNIKHFIANLNENHTLSKPEKENTLSHNIHEEFQNKHIHQKEKFINTLSNISTITDTLVNKIDTVKASKEKNINNISSKTSKPSKREYRKSLFLEPISYFGIDKVNKKSKFKDKNWDEKKIKENVSKRNKMISGSKVRDLNGVESEESESFSNSSEPSETEERDNIEEEKRVKRNGSKNNAQVRWKSHLNKEINNSDESYGSEKNRKYLNGDDSYDKYHERKSILHREINKKKVLKQSKINFNSRFNKSRDSKTVKNQEDNAEKKVRKESKKIDAKSENLKYINEKEQTLADQNGKAHHEEKENELEKINEGSESESSNIHKTKRYKKGQFFLKRKKLHHHSNIEEQNPKENVQNDEKENHEDKCIEGYLRPKADSLVKLTNYVKTNGYLSNMREDNNSTYIKRAVLNNEPIFVHRYHSEDEGKRSINHNKEFRPYQFLTQLNKEAVENWLTCESKLIFEKQINYFEVTKSKHKNTNMDLDLDIPLIRKTGKKPESKWLEKERIALNLGFSIRKIMEANTITQKSLENENCYDF